MCPKGSIYEKEEMGKAAHDEAGDIQGKTFKSRIGVVEKENDYATVC